jgi:small-conductance mechanosensitive channel
VGDRVEVGSLVGTVRKIGARATNIVTNDEIAIIVPNSDFTNQRITNWSYTGRRVRFVIPVGVSYKSNPDLVKQALLEAAAAAPDVDPATEADVVFLGFGDSALLFELRVWTATRIHTPKVFISDMNFAIWSALKRHGIEIPFRQRDLHVRSGSLAVETRPAAAT